MRDAWAVGDDLWMPYERFVRWAVGTPALSEVATLRCPGRHRNAPVVPS
jgi:hypothetical protein